MRHLVALSAVAFALSALVMPVRAQEAPYFHCSVMLTRSNFAFAEAHVQSNDWTTAYDDCITINQLAGGPPSRPELVTGPDGRFLSSYTPGMYRYSIEQLVARDQQPGSVELLACWGVNQTDGSQLVITVEGAPVQYAEPWCEGLRWF
jgi:hypothetical protein